MVADAAGLCLTKLAMDALALRDSNQSGRAAAAAASLSRAVVSSYWRPAAAVGCTKAARPALVLQLGSNTSGCVSDLSLAVAVPSF